LLTPFGEFLLIETKTNPFRQDDIQVIFKSIEEKITNIQNILKKNSTNIEQNQRHLLIIDRFKNKFYKNI
jgi:hypothetical protein